MKRKKKKEKKGDDCCVNKQKSATYGLEYVSMSTYVFFLKTISFRDPIYSPDPISNIWNVNLAEITTPNTYRNFE